MSTTRGAVLIMTLTAALLLGLGVWQFRGIGIEAGEREGHESERDEHALSYGERRESDRDEGRPAATPDDLIARILASYGGRIIETERDHEGGREILEVKLIDGQGQRRELYLDPATGEELGQGH